MNILLTVIAIILIANTALCLYRIAKGPTIPDRMLGINVVGTVTVSVLVIISYIIDSYFYLDVAIIYTLLNFTVTVIISRYLENEGWSDDYNDITKPH